MQVWNVLHAARWNTGIKNRQKFAIWASSHKFVGLYFPNEGTYRQLEKLLKHQYIPFMALQYGELPPTSGWDRFVILRHPSKFQRVSLPGSVTLRHSSSGRQANFAPRHQNKKVWCKSFSFIAERRMQCYPANALKLTSDWARDWQLTQYLLSVVLKMSVVDLPHLKSITTLMAPYCQMSPFYRDRCDAH